MEKFESEILGIDLKIKLFLSVHLFNPPKYFIDSIQYIYFIRCIQ